MNGEDARARARTQVVELVRRFKRNETDYLRATYNETQARTEFITQLLEVFGWDVHNLAEQPLAFREVVEEATVEVGEERLSKRPDYELRLTRQRKLFVEAKKPSVKIDRDRAPAFQTRRYGYSASLPISVVTNFHQLAIYDCKPVPVETDEPHIARLYLVGYEEFEDRFDELWLLLSREVVYSGEFDRYFAIDATRHGAEQFDDFFLLQVRDWRERLAIDIHANTPGLTSEELTYAVQLFLSRIVFLRICEDRDIEKYETLKNLDSASTFDALLAVLRRADEFYDSGLFRLLDDERLGIRISDTTLSGIIGELYYPQSPYTFAVVETEVLGEIYEQFLGEVITVIGGAVEIVSKPEVRESSGVVPTPRFIADSIVERTLGPAIAEKSPEDLIGFTVADTCCGSGIFLLSAYDFLLAHCLDWYAGNDPQAHAGRGIYDAGAGQWKLTFEEKRRILLAHLRGVDIDPNAVEVAQFSLLLKLVEDESSAALKDFVTSRKCPVLPSLSDTIRCGNSLVSAPEWRDAYGEMSPEVRTKVNPFSWENEFPAEMESGGFDIIVGNPPYIRIQNMVAFSPEEVGFYHSDGSPYTTARQDNYDKYSLFIERSLTLTKEHGRIGFITPHKFMTIQAGRALRNLLGHRNVLEQIVHFGVKQVFGRETANYTCILILDRAGSQTFTVEKAGPLEAWRYGQKGPITQYDAGAFDEAPWEFADEEVRTLFERVRAEFPERLSTFADIEVGVQTSADKIYIVREGASDDDTITFRWNDRNWQVERDILRPCLHDEMLYSFTRPQANAWMIFPYELIANADGRVRASLIKPDEMADRYPLCWAYLNARKDELERRNIVGGPAGERQWYQFGRSQSLTKFDRPKIILPVLSIEPRYAFDETNTLFTGGGNGPYYMIRAKSDAPVSTLYLLAILNHPLCEAIIRTNTSPFHGGYYSHGKQFIQNLPIPVTDEENQRAIETLARQTVNATDTLAAARTPHDVKQREREVKDLRTLIEQRVGEVFNLSTTDWETVQSVPIPS